MSDLPWYILSTVGIICFAYAGFRIDRRAGQFLVTYRKHVNALGRLQTRMNSRVDEFLILYSKHTDAQQQATDSSRGSNESFTQSLASVERVASLPPEVIAPALSKPPRSPGGFGVNVGNKDAAESIAPANSNEEPHKESPKTGD